MNALNLDLPGLAEVKTAWNGGNGNAAVARTKLAYYFRNRSAPVWFVDAMTADNQTTANNARIGKYTVAGFTYTFPGGGTAVDFSVNPTSGNEFPYQLNRMAAWTALGRAWRTIGATAYPGYQDVFVAQLRTWVAQSPVPGYADNSSGSSRWRTIEAGIRMRQSWPDAWSYFLRATQFTDNDLLLMLTSFLEHGRYLKAFPTTANWLTMEMSGLYTVGALFPEFREAESWRNEAVSRLVPMTDPASSACQFLPDGMHIEGSPKYHMTAVDNIEGAFVNARQLGTAGDFPPSYVNTLKNAYAFCVRFAGGPQWVQPAINDAGLADTMGWISRRALASWPNDRLFQFAAYAATRGDTHPGPEKPVPDEPSSRFFPDSGFAVMRTGWAANSHCLWFDVGPLGFGVNAGHQHSDKLNVIFWPYGRDLLFDSGGGAYLSTPYRQYAVSTRSHNTVIVDGWEQARWTSTSDPSGIGDPATPAAQWSSQADADWTVGTYQDGWGGEQARTYSGGYKPDGVVRVAGRHQRQVALLKPDGLVVVIDDLKPNPSDTAQHTWQVRWHLRTVTTTTTQNGTTVTSANVGQPNLAVRPLVTTGLQVTRPSGQTSPQYAGWEDAGKPATTVIHARSAAGPVSFVTLLSPIAANSTDPVTGVESIDGGWSVTHTGGTIKILPVGAAGLKLVRTTVDGVTSTTLFGTAVGASPAITSATTATATVGTAFTYQIVASNSPTSYVATGLPAGLTINTSTGAIFGTPTVAGTATVILKATNASGTGTATLVITVNANHAPTINSISNKSTSQESATAPIPIVVGDADGTSGLVVTATSSATVLIPNANLVITGSGTSRWLVATPAMGQYGTSIITVTVSDGIQTASTNFTITVSAVNRSPVNTSIPTITGINAISQTLAASAGTWTDHETAAGSLLLTYQWFRADDTAGANATIIGGATSNAYTVQAGDASAAIRVQVTATDAGYGPAAAASTTAYSAWTAATLPTPIVTSPLTASGVVGIAFTYQIAASNNPTSFNATGLPSGLAIDPATGAITGRPTTAGSTNVTITATNVTGSQSATLAIAVVTSRGEGSRAASGGGGCGAGVAALLLGGLAMIGVCRRRH